MTSKSSNILNAVFRLDDVDSVLFVEPSSTPSSKRGGKKKIKKKAPVAVAAVQRPVGTVGTILSGDGAADEEPAEAILRGIGKRLTRYVGADGKIDFREVFADSAGAGSSLPVKMEICSGSGEWAAQQALSEAGTANWVTLEVKQDRVYQTFLRMVFQNVRNLCAMSGDAVELLPSHIGSGSLSSVFVNHPEPPVQYDGGDNFKRMRGRDEGDAEPRAEARAGEAYGKHLLTIPFFEELERVLAPGGTVTVVTDNLWYGRLILRSLSTMPHPRGLQSVPLPTSRSEAEAGSPGCYSVQDEMSGLVLYRGRPGKDCGHSSEEASSYFDR
jgi:tRNA G46 methylase TrmB